MYGPKLNEVSAVTVRRLAWAMETTMGSAIETMARALPGFINPEKVCPKCRDKKCPACAFYNTGEMPKKALPLLYN